MNQNETNRLQGVRAWTPWLRALGIALLVIALAGGAWAWRYGRPLVDSVEAYVYGFPIVVMDLTREAGTAVPSAGEITAPMNQFAVMTKYPDASFRAVPRTGLDTLFATAWADLEAEPLVLSVPYTGGRYYVIALFDMWSNVFASIGKRTTGTGAASFLIAGPKWQGEAPAGVQAVYRAPTRFVWVNGQMQADGPQDYAAVDALQKQYKLTPLSQWGKDWTPPATVPVPAGAQAGQPIERIRAMHAAEFYTRLARLMQDNPPAPADAPMVARLTRLGLVPGQDIDPAKLNGPAAWALKTSMQGLGLLQWGVTKLKTDEGWIVIPSDFARYGTDYVTRAGIALIGLGGIWPDDVSYPTAFKDGDGRPLDAANSYVLHFDKAQMPPNNATWSVSMYDPAGFYVPNALDRYNLAPWMPLKRNADGSLDIWIGSTSPGADKEANWLPAPKSGLFNLTVRIFLPTAAALDGSYRLPPVRRVQ